MMPLDPWHLWGTSLSLDVAIGSAAATGLTVQTGQLARINYARPDTWSFLFGLEVQGTPAAGLGSPNLTVDFDLIVGLGRSALKIPTVPNAVSVTTNPRGFGRFTVNSATPGTTLWTSTVIAPLLEPGGSPVQPFLDHFVGQDIQCNARVLATDGGPAVGQRYQITVHSYFAPRSHVRPEWYSMEAGDEGRYRGNENRGQ